MENSGRLAKALVEHWSWAAEKGLMNKSTAGSLATVCRRILEIEDNWESLDISTVDVDEIVKRFINLKQKEYKPKSLVVYESRFRRALESYESYLENPSGWQYSSRGSHSRKGKTNASKTATQESPSKEVRIAEPSKDTQQYRYPFRPDYMAKLEIPRDATAHEIERLVGWARTLAVDYTPES